VKEILAKRMVFNVKSNKKNKNPQIMKKAILTIGLFSLVMILTSFTAPEKNNNTKVNIIGQTSTGGNVKVDIIGQTSTGGNVKVDIIGQTSTGGNVKVDIIGQTSTGGNVKVD
jgi:hypothetical protein